MSDPAKVNGPKHKRLITEAIETDRLIAHCLRDLIAEVRNQHLRNGMALGAVDLKIHDLSLALQDVQHLHREMDQLLRNAPKQASQNEIARRVDRIEEMLEALINESMPGDES